VKVTLVITTKNRKEELRLALRSAMTQTVRPEILVLDDGSTDGTAELVRAEFPEAMLYRFEESRGLIVRRNEAARMAQGDIIFSIDDDAFFLTSHVIEQTLTEFDSPQIGAVAIPYIEPHKANRVLQRAPARGDVWITSSFIGTAHALRRDLFLQLGGYREDLIHQGEESDYCIRMLSAGHVVRMGDSDLIEHDESPKRDLRRMDFFGCRNSILFAWQNVPASHLILVFLATTFNCLRWTLQPKRFATRLSGIIDGYSDCFRKDRIPVPVSTYRCWRVLKKNEATRLNEVFISQQMNSSKKDFPADSNLLFLDGLRGLAAFYVMTGHARWLLWEGYSEGFQHHPETYSIIGKMMVYFFALFGRGDDAVLFFFVLSGFVIHLRYARQIVQKGATASFDWTKFVWRRARRLYPPLLAALGLSAILDTVGRSMGFAIYHQATRYPLINMNVVSNLDGVTLLGNLAFLMNTYVPVFGCNGPLWSLKFEWWFYMIYPAFWFLSRRSIALATVLMMALFGASFFPGLWPLQLLKDIFTAMLAWWFGALLADVFTGRLRWPLEIVAAIGILVGALAVGHGAGLHLIGMGLMFTALLALGLWLTGQGIRLTWLEKLKPLGDMSYTLYVTHFPILVLASGWLMSRSSAGLLPQHFGWVFAGMVVTMLVAYGLHFIVERPFLSRVPHQHKSKPDVI